MTLAVIDEAPGVVAAPERIAAWVRAAKAGDVFVYATRASLPAASPGAAEARRLHALGLVRPFQRRILGRIEKYYEVHRTDVPWLDDVPARGTRRVAADDVPADVLDTVYQVLARAARFGRPCPTDLQIAERVGQPREIVADALSALADSGAIVVARVRAPTLRRVTVVLSGLTTGVIGGRR